MTVAGQPRRFGQWVAGEAYAARCLEVGGGDVPNRQVDLSAGYVDAQLRQLAAGIS